MNNKVPAYGEGKCQTYLLSELFDPAAPGSSLSNVATFIPRVGSIVVDDTTGEHNTLYVVYHVDPVSHKATLVPAKLQNDIDLMDNQIITYGNNIYMLYWIRTTVEIYEKTTDTYVRQGKVYYSRTETDSPYGDTKYVYTRLSLPTGMNISDHDYYAKVTKSLWKLVPDRKISVVGDRIKSFAIFAGANLVSASTSSIVSNYYMNESGQAVQTNRIAMDEVTVPVTDGSGEQITAIAKIPVPCYSETEVKDGDPYVLVLYDEDDRVIAQITMISHTMLGLSELASLQWPVESFTVTANQYDPVDGKCFLTRGQRLDELVFYPCIRYANNDSISDAAIDNTQLFIFGKDQISTDIPGEEYKVLLKYYLNNNESVSEDRDYQIGETGRFIYTFVTVKIIAPSESSISKIIPILQFNSASGWSVLPIAYYRNRQMPRALGDTSWGDGTFNGKSYSIGQTLRIHAFEQDPNSAMPTEFTSSYSLTLFDPTVTAGNPKINYYFRDEPSTTNNVYGKNTALVPRARIFHEINRAAGTTRTYIPKGIFPTSTIFLNAFYYQADPPSVAGESPAKTPTHFQIRKPVVLSNSISVISVNPIPISEYANDLALNDDVSNDETIPGTAIVEFLYHGTGMAANSFEYLYAVPVDVIKIISDAPTGDWHDTLYCTYDGINYILDPTGGDTINQHRTWGSSALNLIAVSATSTTFKWALHTARGALLTDGVSDAIDIATGITLDPSQVEWSNSSVTYMSRYPWPVIGNWRGTLYVRINGVNYTCPYTGPEDAINVKRSWTVKTEGDVAIGTIDVRDTSGDGFKWFITIVSGENAGQYVCDQSLTGSSTEDPSECTWDKDSRVTWVRRTPPPVITVETPVNVTGIKGSPITTVQLHAVITGASETLRWRYSGFPSGLTVNSAGQITGTPRNYGSFVGAVIVSSANSNAVTITVNFTIANSSTFRGPLYAILNGIKYVFIHSGPDLATDIDREWADDEHKTYIKAVTDETAEVWHWAFFRLDPYDNPVEILTIQSEEKPMSELYHDPDYLTWTDPAVSKLTYLSRTPPAEITVTSPITITATAGAPLPLTILSATAGNGMACTFAEKPSFPIPGGVELSSTGQISGLIAAAGEWVSKVKVTAPACPDAEITVNFVIADVILCYRSDLYVITRGDMTYRRFRYAAEETTVPWERIWIATDNSGLTIRQTHDNIGYFWTLLDATNTEITHAYDQMNAQATTEPFNCSWPNPEKILYISKDPTSVIDTDSVINIDFRDTEPIQDTYVRLGSLIGNYPSPITLSCSQLTELSEIHTTVGGKIHGTISNVYTDQSIIVQVSCNIVNISPKQVNVIFHYAGGAVFRGPLYVHAFDLVRTLTYQGNGDEVSINRAWTNENTRITGRMSPATSVSPAIYQWDLTTTDQYGDWSNFCFGQEETDPNVDPDETSYSEGSGEGQIIVTKIPFSVETNETEITLEVGQTRQLSVTDYSNQDKLIHGFHWRNEVNDDNQYFTVSESGLVTAVAAYDTTGGYKYAEAYAVDATGVRTKVKVIITSPAPGPGEIVTNSPVYINFTPGVAIDHTLTAQSTNATNITWGKPHPDSMPETVSIDTNGRIQGTINARVNVTGTVTVTASNSVGEVSATVTVVFVYTADNVFRGKLYVTENGIEYELDYDTDADPDMTFTGMERKWKYHTNPAWVIEDSPMGSVTWVLSKGSDGPKSNSTIVQSTDDPDANAWTNGYLVSKTSILDLMSANLSQIKYLDNYPIEDTLSAAQRTILVTSSNTNILPNGFTYTASNLPAGITMSTSGVFTGTVTNPSDTPVVVNVTATSTNHNKVSKSFQVTFSRNMSESTVISTASPVTIRYTSGTQFSHTLTAVDSGGGTLRWEDVDLPAGVTIGQTGTIVGTLTGTASLTGHVKVITSSVGGQPYATVTVNFVPAADPEPDVIITYANDSSETLPHVAGTGNLSRPDLREWMLSSNTTGTYTHLYSQSVGVPEGDTVWYIERGQWVNNMPQQGTIYASSSPCWAEDGPTVATWDSTKVTSVVYAST